MQSGELETASHRVHFRRANNAIGEGELQCGVVRDQSGRPRMVVLQLEDLTERIRSEEEARANRERLAHVARLSAMGEMAAGIAHEINQPLAAIATFARACSRMIESGQGEQADYLQALEKINAQALRAGDVIHRLRSFVKKQESRRDACNVNELVRDVARFAEIDTRTGNVSIRLELAPSLPTVSVDPEQIQQVLLNLVRIGLESMRTQGVGGGTVDVRTAPRDGGDVEVLVMDRGSGIAEHVEGELLHPFFTTKSFGMGMGLAISRSIVSAHGGELWFTRNEGGGTTFHFTLPASGTEGEGRA
jgi:C4-dicarboxylate-specific signal transduction histidine kinase